MQCEICGRLISEGKRVRLEGSIVVACDSCASCGQFVGFERRAPPAKELKKVEERKRVERDIDFDVKKTPLVDDYNLVVKRARERRGLKQEELAKLLNEPVSLIHRIESGRFEPEGSMIKKLEKKLGVRLVDSSLENMQETASKQFPKELTLGDIVVVKKKSK